jgi:hypothetical protein
MWHTPQDMPCCGPYETLHIKRACTEPQQKVGASDERISAGIEDWHRVEHLEESRVMNACVCQKKTQAQANHNHLTFNSADAHMAATALGHISHALKSDECVCVCGCLYVCHKRPHKFS